MHPPHVTDARPQSKTPLDCYIKDKRIGERPDGFPPGTDLIKQQYKEEFDLLSAAKKKQYEEEALLSLEQYQEVPCCTRSPQCLCASLYTALCIRGLCVPCPCPVYLRLERLCP